jgi:rod shape-determining protein MreC
MNQNRRKGKTTLVILSLICIALITISIIGARTVSPVTGFTGMIITPIQNGMNQLGTFLSGFSENLTDAATLREENAQLQVQVDSLKAENSKLVLNKEELDRLQNLLELKEQYTDYDTVGAHIISKGSGNWFTTFTIDKGTNDGIQIDCNVLAGAGLCGIVTQCGPNWSRVRAIIDDDSNVSAMISTTSDTCIVAGNLQLLDEGTLSLVKLTDDNNHVHVGDKVVTSSISEKYLPGILIGYISELNNDANNLTKSGTVNPAVDFHHLQEVLVIRTLKEYIPSEGEVPEEASGSGSFFVSSDGSSEFLASSISSESTGSSPSSICGQPVSRLTIERIGWKCGLIIPVNSMKRSAPSSSTRMTASPAFGLK